MKLSNETVAVLKNFAAMNPSVVLRPGKVIRTVSTQKTIIAVASVDEEFDTQAGIYDISRFLSTLSLFKEPEIVFGENRFTVRGDRTELKYTYTSENMIVTPPIKDLVIPNPITTIPVEWKSIESATRAAGVLQLPEIAFVCDGDTITLTALDHKTPTADTFSVVVADNCESKSFRIIINVGNIKLMPNDYDVTLSNEGIVHFKSDAIQYWVASESI